MSAELTGRTVATRFYRWTRSDLWDRLLAELRRIADAAGGIDWAVHVVDGTSVRAHRCADRAAARACCAGWVKPATTARLSLVMDDAEDELVRVDATG